MAYGKYSIKGCAWEVHGFQIDNFLTKLKGDKSVEGSELPGVCHLYTMGNGGYCVKPDSYEGLEEMDITLTADGTGTMLLDGNPNTFRWVQEDGEVTLYDETGTIPFTGMIELEPVAKGVFRLRYPSRDMSIIYALDGADTSMIEAISVEEYRAQTS